jgi:hypothetical protein
MAISCEDGANRGILQIEVLAAMRSGTLFFPFLPRNLGGMMMAGVIR